MNEVLSKYGYRASAVLLFCLLIWQVIRFVFWIMVFRFCNIHEQRTTSVYFGEEWQFPLSGNEKECPDALDPSFLFAVNDDVISIGTRQGASVTNNGFIIMTTPLFDNDFTYKESVYHSIDVENSVRPSMKSLLIDSSRKLKQQQLLLKEKIATMAISNHVHLVRKTPYIGLAYRLENPPRALLFVDSGNTNKCISIFVQQQMDYSGCVSIEDCCKTICATMEFR